MKTASERPNLWYLIVTIFAMLYLSCFSSSFITAIYSNTLSFATIICGMIFAFAWAFLILDFIKQISLFYQRKTK